MLTLRVESIVDRADRIRAFVLADAQGKALPAVEAGAHLEVQVRLPGGEAAKRHYSLVEPGTAPATYEIAVLREAAGRGGSAYLHDAVRVGDVLEVTEPRNAFPLLPAADTLLIAGGIGITPILAMARSLSRGGARARLAYFGRTTAAMAYVDEVQDLAGIATSIVVQADPQAVRSELARLLSQRGTDSRVYVCGPSGLIRAVQDAAAAAGWPEDRVHHESFAGIAAQAGDAPFRVNIARSGRSFEVPADRTLLDALAEVGIAVPADCRSGICGTCMTPVLAGEVVHRDKVLTPQDHAEGGLICPCVSRGAPGTTLVLDL